MKLIVNNTDFGSIGTAVLYTWPGKYLPSWTFKETLEEVISDLGLDENYTVPEENVVDFPNNLPNIHDLTEDIVFMVDDYYAYYKYTDDSSWYNDVVNSGNLYKAVKKLYYGNKNSIVLRDFAEYDFSWLIDKYKFNDDFKISYLDDYSKNKIGKRVEDLSRIEQVLLPTLSKSNSTSNYDYFGSTTIGTSIFYLFPATSGIYKIELYEGIIEDQDIYEYSWRKYTDYQGQDIKPDLTIYLGPNPQYSCIPGNNYYGDSNTYFSAGTYLPTGQTYLHELDERVNEKVVWMILSDTNEIRDINISYRSWKEDKENAERNKNRWALRNDEYYGTYRNMRILETGDTGFTYDTRSGSLLGSGEKITSTPILNHKLERIDENIYSPYKTYKLGDIVYCDGYNWESVVRFNKGNHPGKSQGWITAGKIDNILTPRITVALNISGAGSVIPGYDFNISEGETKSFTVIENLGYELESDTERIISPITGEYTNASLITYNSFNEDGNSVEKTTISVSDWSRILETEQMIFNFVPVDSKITFKAIYNNTEYPYGSWNFNSENITLTGTKNNNNFNITGGVNNIPARSEITFNPGNIIKNKITKVVSHEKFRGVITDRELSGFSDTVNYSETTYYFYIEKNVKTIIPQGIANYELSDYNLEVFYGNDAMIQFYTIGNHTFTNLTIDFTESNNSITLRQGESGTVNNMFCSLTVDSSGIYSLEIDDVVEDIIVNLN